MKTQFKEMSFSDKIKRVSVEVISYIMPGSSYPTENYKMLPLPVAIAICLVGILVSIGFVLVIVTAISNYL